MSRNRRRRIRVAGMPSSWWSALAAAGVALSVAGCAPAAQGSRGVPTAPAASPARSVYLSPAGFKADLRTPRGIHVKTNGQYRTEAERRSAALTIDRYWRQVSQCTSGVLPPGDVHITRLMKQFPTHLSIEIADDWKIVKGPESHRRQQAFPSLMRPGAWTTARREEEALYIKVVPELVGLGPQMAGELNLFLGGNTNNRPTELSNLCATLPCLRFYYRNAPSEAWRNCRD